MSEDIGIAIGSGTIPDLLRARVAETPRAIAYFYESPEGWKEIDWQTFGARVHSLAAALRRLGLQSGEHVGILSPTGLGWELFHHAILLAGGVVVGLEPHDIPERLQWVADHAELRMLVAADTSFVKRLGSERTASYRAVVLLASGSDDESAPHVVCWSDMEADAPDEPDSIAADSPATLIYTSGTTGLPKGILYRHDQAVLAVQAIADAYPSLPVGARLVCWLPLANLFQRIMNLAAMKIGGTVYLVADPLQVLKALPHAKPDVFIGVPRFYEKLHEGIRREIARKPQWLQKVIENAIRIGDAAAAVSRRQQRVPFGLRALRYLADVFILRKLRSVMGGRVRFMVTGSAPTPTRLLEFFHAIGLPLFEAYGLSENIVPVALNRPSAFRFGTVGTPLPQNIVRIDRNGEVQVKGAGVFSGYYKDTGEARLAADGYYTTGDYATLDDQGFLSLKGRNSDIIKTSTGRRIAPLGIESKLEELDWVERAVVIGAGRKCLAAILVLAPGAGARVAKLDQGLGIDTANAQQKNLEADLIHCATAMAVHERPAGYLLTSRQLSIDGGELTPNLKLRRAAVEARYASQLDKLYQDIDLRSDELVLTQVDEVTHS